MKAVVYKGPREVAVENVDDPHIEQPLDAIIRITTANICGSDLHPYEGRASMDSGMVFGHENMGVIVEVGSAVNRVKVGDRVSVPFNIACGTCRNCNNGFTSACLRANPSGTQAPDTATPRWDRTGVARPSCCACRGRTSTSSNFRKGTEWERDFTMLSDIFPTGYHGVELSGLNRARPSRSSGPGRSDSWPRTVPPCGAPPRSSSSTRSRTVSLSPSRSAPPRSDLRTATRSRRSWMLTDGFGVDRGVEAVGFQAHDPAGQEHPELALDGLVSVVRATGGIGVVGVYVPEDPGAATEPREEGRVASTGAPPGRRGSRFGTGQCPVKRYNRELRDLIIRGKAHPGTSCRTSCRWSRHPTRSPIRRSRRRLDEGTAAPRRPGQPDSSPGREGSGGADTVPRSWRLGPGGSRTDAGNHRWWRASTQPVRSKSSFRTG